jgi:uncharacterized membrane protein
VAGFLAAGCGAYGLARRLLEPRAGLIAATSYLFAPFIYLIDPHLRGDLPEFFPWDWPHSSFGVSLPIRQNPHGAISCPPR